MREMWKGRWSEKGMAKQRPVKARKGPKWLLRENQGAERYGCRDFSKAKISRTNFLAAWDRATL